MTRAIDRDLRAAWLLVLATVVLFAASAILEGQERVVIRRQPAAVAPPCELGMSEGTVCRWVEIRTVPMNLNLAISGDTAFVDPPPFVVPVRVIVPPGILAFGASIDLVLASTGVACDRTATPLEYRGATQIVVECEN